MGIFRYICLHCHLFFLNFWNCWNGILLLSSISKLVGIYLPFVTNILSLKHFFVYSVINLDLTVLLWQGIVMSKQIFLVQGVCNLVYFSKWGVSLNGPCGSCKVKTLFIIRCSYFPFSLCWYLLWQCRSNDR